MDGAGTRTPLFRSPGPKGKLGKCSRKEGNREERTRKGASEVNSISAMGFPLLSNILILASKTLDSWLCFLTNVMLLRSPLTHHSATKLCAFP